MRIFAPVGGYGSVREAAHAEDSLDWQRPYGSDHRACVLSFAAEEIAVHLTRIPGVSCELAPLADSCGEPGIYLMTAGESHGAACGIQHDALRDEFGDFEVPEPEQSYTIATAGTTGNDAESIRYLVLDRLDLSPVVVTEAPSFFLRGFWATDDRGTEAFLLWMARNKLNLWSAEQPEKAFCRKLGIRFTTGGHSIFARYADPKRHFADHPKWYGLQNGERSDRIDGVVGDNICFANTEVRRHIASSLVEDLIAGDWKWVDLINVWALDNGRYCTCD